MNDYPMFPHCDTAILHAPGVCDYCDDHPDWQQLREAWGIAFTGDAPKVRQLPCPSDFRRPGGVNQMWSGNQAARRE